MKKRYFKILNLNDQARYVARHFPEGRAWNTRTGSSLYKFIKALAVGIGTLFSAVWNTIQEFDISTSTPEGFLPRWEESLGIIIAGESVDERRRRVKAQLRKVATITKSETETELERFLGYPVEVRPDPVSTDTTFPYVFPIFFWGGDYGDRQSRFLMYVVGVNSGDKEAVRAFLKKFQPNNIYVIMP